MRPGLSSSAKADDPVATGFVLGTIATLLIVWRLLDARFRGRDIL
jgi:hypothetical protein